MRWPFSVERKWKKLKTLFVYRYKTELTNSTEQCWKFLVFVIVIKTYLDSTLPCSNETFPLKRDETDQILSNVFQHIAVKPQLFVRMFIFRATDKVAVRCPRLGPVINLLTYVDTIAADPAKLPGRVGAPYLSTIQTEGGCGCTNPDHWYWGDPSSDLGFQLFISAGSRWRCEVWSFVIGCHTALLSPHFVAIWVLGWDKIRDTMWIDNLDSHKVTFVSGVDTKVFTHVDTQDRGHYLHEPRKRIVQLE